VEPTAPNSSHQNGPGERPHQTIGDAMRTLLGGSGLPPKFWPYAFHHFLRLYNITVHGDNTQSPFEKCNGHRPNLRYLRVFGCRVYALPNRDRRPDKPLADARVGIFLGFTKSMKNVLYYDVVTETVKEAQHVAFDEAMNDLSAAEKPPNARMLDSLRSGSEKDVLDLAVPLPDIAVSTRAFIDIDAFTAKLNLDSSSPLGMEFETCSRLHRAYVSTIHQAPVGRKIRSFRRSYLGSYVVSVNDTPVYAPSDIERVLAELRASDGPPSTVPIELAPERKSDHNATARRRSTFGCKIFVVFMR